MTRPAGSPGTAAGAYRADHTHLDRMVAAWEARPADPDGTVERMAQALIRYMPPMNARSRTEMAREAAVAALQTLKTDNAPAGEAVAALRAGGE